MNYKGHVVTPAAAEKLVQITVRIKNIGTGTFYYLPGEFVLKDSTGMEFSEITREGEEHELHLVYSIKKNQEPVSVEYRPFTGEKDGAIINFK